MGWFDMPLKIAVGIALAHVVERVLVRLFG
jgi:hypothetical protein